MSETTRYCTHGLVQRKKYGTTKRASGAEVCNGCGLLIAESVGAWPSKPSQQSPVRQSGGLSEQDSHNLKMIRWSLAIIVALIGVWLLIHSLSEPDPKVCVYYTDGTSECTDVNK